MAVLTGNQEDELEHLLDLTSCQAVLESLSKICAAKACHLMENWQNSNEAKIWEKASKEIEKAAGKVSSF